MSRSQAFEGWAAVLIPRPDDPAEAEQWADEMVRVQVAMWVDEGAVCARCQQPYASVDDFLARQPRYAGDGPVFVDDACWSAWLIAAEGRDVS